MEEQRAVTSLKECKEYQSYTRQRHRNKQESYRQDTALTAGSERGSHKTYLYMTRPRNRSLQLMARRPHSA